MVYSQYPRVQIQASSFGGMEIGVQKHDVALRRFEVYYVLFSPHVVGGVVDSEKPMLIQAMVLYDHGGPVAFVIGEAPKMS